MCHLVGFGVAAPSFVPPLPGGRRPLTHSPRRKVVSGPATRRVPTPPLLGDAKRWCCFGSQTLPSRTVALIMQSYPAALEVTLFYSVDATDGWSLVEVRVRKDSASAE